MPRSRPTPPPLRDEPDFDHAGQIVDWSDNVPADERFVPAVDAALSNLGEDFELCRWHENDPTADAHTAWWTTQSRALRRALKADPRSAGRRITVRRRVDAGWHVCYLRVNRVRSVTAVAS